jgi:hypothetical protein
MAASNWTVYTAAELATMQGACNWGAATIHCALLTAAYTPATNTDALWSAISVNEVVGAGYTAGGVAVTAPTVTASGGTVTAAGTIATWSSSTITARWAVLYDAATGKLLAFSDLSGGGAVPSSTNGSFGVSAYSITGTHTP